MTPQELNAPPIKIIGNFTKFVLEKKCHVHGYNYDMYCCNSWLGSSRKHCRLNNIPSQYMLKTVWVATTSAEQDSKKPAKLVVSTTVNTIEISTNWFQHILNLPASPQLRLNRFSRRRLQQLNAQRSMVPAVYYPCRQCDPSRHSSTDNRGTPYRQSSTENQTCYRGNRAFWVRQGGDVHYWDSCETSHGISHGTSRRMFHGTSRRMLTSHGKYQVFVEGSNRGLL